MDDRQQEIIDELRRVANLLNVNSLAQREFSKNSKLAVKTIENRFGSWNRAIEAAGLIPILPRHKDGQLVRSDEELLQEIIRLSSELGKRPTESEVSAFGQFGIHSYRNRWGKLSEAINIAFSKYGVPTGVSLVSTAKSKPEKVEAVVPPSEPVQTLPSKVYAPSKRTQYGEQMDFRGLRHAPLSEQGVVYMFGMVSRELGFLIEAVRIAYPDCLGKRLVNKNPQRWEDVRIEFEFKSSNFDHDPEGCDLIVCWIHDWKDSPLEVLELRSAIGYLPNK